MMKNINGTKTLWNQIAEDVLIGIDANTGGLISLQVQGVAVTFDSPSRVLLSIGGHEASDWKAAPGNNLIGDRSITVVGSQEIDLASPVQQIELLNQGIRVLRSNRDFSIKEDWLWLNGSSISRSVSISWGAGNQTGPVRESALLSPGFRDSGEVFSRFIGMATPPGWARREIDTSLSGELRSEFGLSGTVPLMADVGSAALGMKSEENTILIGLADLNFPLIADFEKDQKFLSAGHRIRSAAHCSSPGSLQIGPQVMTFTDSLSEFGKAVRGEVAGFSPIADWLRGATIYEVHIGNKFPDPFAPNTHQGKNPYPNVDALISDLGRIRDLGFDVIQLMPLFPFPGYTIVDYFDAPSQYGGEETLNSLAKAASASDIRLVVDFILHGPVDQGIGAYADWAPERSKYLDIYPEWFMRDEVGKIRQTHTYSFDLANSELQNHLAEAMLQLLRLGVAGFRVDAPLWNLFPNWDEALSYAAGHSTMGWVEILRKVRLLAGLEGLEVGLIGETAGVIGAATFDAIYGYEEMGLFRNFVMFGQPFLAVGLYVDEKMTANQIRDWMLEKAAFFGAEGFSRTIRHFDSHDSYEWGSLSAFAKNLFGEAFPALLTLGATLPGPWMHFCGAEEGIENLISNTLKLRSHPAVRDGLIDFAASATEDPSIFHFVSRSGGECQLVVANLSNHSLEVNLTLQKEVASLLAQVVGADSSASMRQNDCRIQMGPWGYRVYQTVSPEKGVIQ